MKQFSGLSSGGNCESGIAWDEVEAYKAYRHQKSKRHDMLAEKLLQARKARITLPSLKFLERP